VSFVSADTEIGTDAIHAAYVISHGWITARTEWASAGDWFGECKEVHVQNQSTPKSQWAYRGKRWMIPGRIAGKVSAVTGAFNAV